MVKKVQKVIDRGYVRVGDAQTQVLSCLHCFAVPKGNNDIRMVYDATGNGLNQSVWVPTFWLPTTNTLLRGLNKDS